MSNFDKYLNCEYLICHTTYEYNKYKHQRTFEKGVKYRVTITNLIPRHFICFNLLIDRNDIEFLSNFHTLSEHRKSIIENVI